MTFGKWCKLSTVRQVPVKGNLWGWGVALLSKLWVIEVFHILMRMLMTLV